MLQEMTLPSENLLTLADLMRKDIPFGKCGHQAMQYFNKRHETWSEDVSQFLCILFQNGTPDFPVGVDSLFNGSEYDPRIQLFVSALDEYELKEGGISSDVCFFLPEYLAFLDMPVDNEIIRGRINKMKKKEVSEVEDKRQPTTIQIKVVEPNILDQPRECTARPKNGEEGDVDERDPHLRKKITRKKFKDLKMARRGGYV